MATVGADGLVTAVANGTATITAVSTFNTSKKGTVAVTVVSPTPIVPPVQPNDDADVAGKENNFWISVVALIQSAKKGDMLRIDTGAYTKMPACVMEELRIKGAGLVIKWNGGKDIVIPVGKAHNAEKNREVWTLAELSKIYNKYSFGNKKSPKTGVDSYEIVDNQTGVTTPIKGNVVDTTTKQDSQTGVTTPITNDAVVTTTTQGSQTGKYILVMVVGALVAVAAVLGVYIWSRKKKQEEE